MGLHPCIRPPARWRSSSATWHASPQQGWAGAQEAPGGEGNTPGIKPQRVIRFTGEDMGLERCLLVSLISGKLLHSLLGRRRWREEDATG